MPYTIGLVFEQTLGHITHDQNLRDYLAGIPDVRPIYIPIAPWTASDLYQRIPFIKDNLSVRARINVAAALRQSPADVLFFHTQITALLSGRFARRTPMVISLDGTQENMEALALTYGRTSGTPASRLLKHHVHRRTYRRATRLVCWSRWAAFSLERDYGIAPEKITVIPPGVDCAAWQPASRAGPFRAPLRLLFVGGDFARKGGHLLLEMFRASSGAVANCTLDIVTRVPIREADGLPNVRVHTGIKPNSPALKALFAEADVFVLPTLADTLGIVFMEAMACGLPVIATNMAGIPELVEDGKTGILIPRGDAAALGAAIMQMQSAQLRQNFGAVGRQAAVQKFSAAKNYGRLVELLKNVADGNG